MCSRASRPGLGNWRYGAKGTGPWCGCWPRRRKRVPVTSSSGRKSGTTPRRWAPPFSFRPSPWLRGRSAGRWPWRTCSGAPSPTTIRPPRSYRMKGTCWYFLPSPRPRWCMASSSSWYGPTSPCLRSATSTSGGSCCGWRVSPASSGRKGAFPHGGGHRGARWGPHRGADARPPAGD